LSCELFSIHKSLRYSYFIGYPTNVGGDIRYDLLAFILGHLLEKFMRAVSRKSLTCYQAPEALGHQYKKYAQMSAYKKGKNIGVGREIDWNKDKKVDISHCATAIFLSEFEGANYAQLPAIQQQLPHKDKNDILFPAKSQNWYGLLSSRGVIKGKFSNAKGVVEFMGNHLLEMPGLKIMHGTYR